SLNSPKPTELVQDYRPRLAFREFPLDQKLRCHTVYLGDDEGIDAGPIQPSAAALFIDGRRFRPYPFEDDTAPIIVYLPSDISPTRELIDLACRNTKGIQ